MLFHTLEVVLGGHKHRFHSEDVESLEILIDLFTQTDYDEMRTLVYDTETGQTFDGYSIGLIWEQGDIPFNDVPIMAITAQHQGRHAQITLDTHKGSYYVVREGYATSYPTIQEAKKVFEDYLGVNLMLNQLQSAPHYLHRIEPR